MILHFAQLCNLSLSLSSLSRFLSEERREEESASERETEGCYKWVHCHNSHLTEQATVKRLERPCVHVCCLRACAVWLVTDSVSSVRMGYKPMLFAVWNCLNLFLDPLWSVETRRADALALAFENSFSQLLSLNRRERQWCRQCANKFHGETCK